jgi:universal stress protein F
MIGRILAAVDDSPRAAGVVALAHEFGERFDAPVHVFRVTALPPEVPPAAHMMTPDPLVPAWTARITAELQALTGGRSRLVVEPPCFAQDTPWRVILEAADRLDVDLIVVGSHGFAGWDRLLGTNAGHLADHSRRHVLVVHDRP